MNPSYIVEIVEGDITKEAVDAIVNAANEALVRGGGVDAAIHRLAGPELQRACLALGGCPTGEARLTPGFRLRARFVIHTVGPVWRGGTSGEPQALAACYRASFALAEREHCRSIALPAISTGIYGYPVEAATRIAWTEAQHHGASAQSLERVRFVCFDAPTRAVYERIAGEHHPPAA